MPEDCDILITHAHLITMQGPGVGYIADGAVSIKGKRIAAVSTTTDLTKRFITKKTIDCTNCAVLPGLIDAHMHTTLAILRGVAQDVSNWMQQALAPYTRHMNSKSSVAGSKLNAVEALKAGTTTHCDYGVIYDGWGDFYDQQSKLFIEAKAAIQH
jgi:5-methylthioadenosine/S-adenosylhomocysteine deaminase